MVTRHKNDFVGNLYGIGSSQNDVFDITAQGKQGVGVGMEIKRATENKLTVKLLNV